MLSGVAPNGTCQRKSPVSRLIAVMRLYGGLMSGSPCTVRFSDAASTADTAGVGAVAAPAPEPPVSRAPARTVPWKYGRSDRPGGGGTRPSVAIDVWDATYSVCVSGSYEPPGQFVAAACAPIVNVAIGPSIRLTDGGVKMGPIL